MENQSKNIKETKEMLEAANSLIVYLLAQFRDGVQFEDFLSLYQHLTVDPVFKQKMLSAYLGVNQIPAELKDLDVGEIVELTSLQLGYIPKILDALKKPL